MTNTTCAYKVTLHAYPLDYHTTPIDYFARLKHLSGAVLLDSGTPSAEAGRYDIISALPLAELITDTHGIAHCERHPDLPTHPIEAQRQLLAMLSWDARDVPEYLPFRCGLMGAWSYDFGRWIEDLAPADSASILQHLPLVRLGLYDWALVQDHVLKQSWLIASEHRALHIQAILKDKAPRETNFLIEGNFISLTQRHQYTEAFKRIQNYIHAGDCYQTNLTQAFQAPYKGSEWQAYLHLRRATPSPFSAYMTCSEACKATILSVSPERFVRMLDHDVITQPIKGTRPRGDTAEQDAAYARALEQSTKDRAENVMIVDLLRNDLGRVCQPGSIRVPELAKRIGYSNVHHLVSTICGHLEDNKDAHDLLAASLPGGSITGAPKHRAMEIIDEVENTPRSFYCGSIGYIDCTGGMDTSIAIRTAIASEGKITLWGGGGIVADSCEQEEYMESITKIQRLMQSLGGCSTKEASEFPPSQQGMIDIISTE